MRVPLLLLFLFALHGIRAQTCTVVCWNIRYDNAGDSLDRWDQRRDALAREVLRQRPQIIGLQEVLLHQAEYLDAQWPGHRRFGVGREDGVAKGEFSPIYFDTTMFRFISGRTIWLSPTPDTPSKGWDAACERIASYVILYDLRTGDSLHVVNTHWDHEGVEARLNSARIIVDLIKPLRARNAHILLMGDFNTTVDQAPLRELSQVLENCAPTHALSQGTFNGFDVDRDIFDRIDHVWRSPRNWELLRYEVPQPTVSGRHVSDHFPVVVGLRAR